MDQPVDEQIDINLKHHAAREASKKRTAEKYVLYFTQQLSDNSLNLTCEKSTNLKYPLPETSYIWLQTTSDKS